MLKSLSKLFMITTMLTAFFGQVQAFNGLLTHERFNESTNENAYQTAYKNINLSTLTANISINDNKTINNTFKESDHDIIDCPDIDCCEVDCCDNECVCASNGCSSIIYVNSDINTTHITIHTETITLAKSKEINSITTLPYRPPIFTS